MTNSVSNNNNNCFTAIRQINPCHLAPS